MKKQLLLAVLITATYAVAAQICQDNPTFTEKTAISTTADGAVSVYAADVDGDGDVDVLSASANDDKIAWYENTCVNCTPPVISDEPDAITACAGSATSFTVAARLGYALLPVAGRRRTAE